MKKIMALVLAAAMLLTMASFAGAEDDVVKLTWAMGAAGPAPIDNALVLEELNKMSREKIGVECDIQYLTNDQFGASINAGEVYDIYFTCSWLNNTMENISNGIFADIAPYMDQVPGLRDAMSKDVWDLATNPDGAIYAIPVKKDYAIENFLSYPADIAKDLGFEIPEVIESWDELTPFLQAWKKTLPENQYPVTIGGSPSGIGSSFDIISGTALFGCTFGDTKVIPMLEDPAVRERFRTMAKWYDLGLVNPDAAQISETAVDRKVPHIGFEQAWDGYDFSVVYGYNTAMTRYNGPNINVNGVMGSMNALSSALEEDPERLVAALKYIELLHVDQLFNDTMRYGVQGVHWNYVTEEQNPECAGCVTRTPLGTTNYNPWGFSQPAYFATSLEVSQAQVDGEAKAPVLNQYEMYYNNVASSAKVSAMGAFVWDSSMWTDALAEISAILDEYYGDMACGAVNIDDVYDEFMEKMNAAGYQDMMADAQEQLDAYLAETAE